MLHERSINLLEQYFVGADLLISALDTPGLIPPLDTYLPALARLENFESLYEAGKAVTEFDISTCTAGAPDASSTATVLQYCDAALEALGQLVDGIGVLVNRVGELINYTSVRRQREAASLLAGTQAASRQVFDLPPPTPKVFRNSTALRSWPRASYYAPQIYSPRDLSPLTGTHCRLGPTRLKPRRRAPAAQTVCSAPPAFRLSGPDGTITHTASGAGLIRVTDDHTDSPHGRRRHRVVSRAGGAANSHRWKCWG